MTPIPEDLWSDLDPALPVTLLPVRLEFRRAARAGVDAQGQPVEIPVLKVRIYPDEVSVAEGREGLREREISAGLAFWSEHGAPPDGAEVGDPAATAHRRHAAWEVLTRTVGTGRAPFVADATRDGAPAAIAGDDAPATARLLPDSWAVVGHAGGARVLRELVPIPADSIQVGASSAADKPPFDPADPHLVADPELRWITDFAAAEERGMGVTIDIPGGLTGLDSLVVLGVRAPSTGHVPAEEADRLADLLSAHTISDRVAFVPAGTPTNNLSDRRSGWTGSPDPFAAYERVVAEPGPAGPPAAVPGALRGEDGATAEAALTAALGLAPGTLASVDHAGDEGLRHARAMARAVFPVTFGELLGTLLHPVRAEGEANEKLLDELDAAIRFTTPHVSSYVRARGPLPVLRVGRQPYGVLPVTLVDRWSPQAGDPALLPGLVSLLRRLRPFWDDAAGEAPVLGTNAGGIEGAAAGLMRILGHAPVPHPGAYEVTTATGPIGTLVFSRKPPLLNPQNLAVADIVRDAGIQSSVAAEVRRLGYRVLVGTVARFVRGSILEALKPGGRKPLRVPVAQTAGARTPADYLLDLSNSAPAPDDEPLDLLYQLVRRSIVLAGEYDSHRVGRAVTKTRMLAALSLPSELRHTGIGPVQELNIVLNAPIRTVQGAGDPQLPAAAAATSIRDLVESRGLTDGVIAALGLDRSHVEGFPGTAAAARLLADAGHAPNGIDDASYARLLGEALACASTRYDAWITSIATQRLDAQRAARPGGAQLGCWGALVDLRWGQPVIQPGPDGWTAPDGSTDVRRPARQVGYVHAPSLDQARLGGVLRSAELSHGADGSTLASLDVTSRRARIARDFLDAIANGQPLGALLGARLERALGDAGLHAPVTALRKSFPQHRAAGGAGEPAAGSDTVVPGEVVDGLDVWKALKGDPARVRQIAGAAANAAALDAALADLDVAVESVADGLTAEGVHHLVCGRSAMAGATFGAIATGSQPPVELDCVRTPRAGTTITHRLVLAVGGGDDGAAGWDRTGPRARLAGELERWVERILGDAGDYRAAVSGTGPGGAPVSTVLTLDEARVGALDVVVEAGGLRPGGAQHSALHDRLAAAAGVSAGLQVTDDAGDDSWSRLVALAGAVAALLSRARPAVPADLTPPPQEPRNSPGGVIEGPPPPAPASLQPLATTLAAVLDELAAAVVAAAAAQFPVEVGDGEPAPDALLAAFAALGLPGSIVAAGTATAGAVRSAAATATGILSDVDRILADRKAAGPTRGEQVMALTATRDGVDALTTLVRRIAGDAVVPTPPVPSELGAHRVNDIDGDAIAEWVERSGRVRDAFAAVDDVRLFVDAAGRDIDVLSAVQLPLVAGEPWLGGPLGPSASANGLRAWRRPDGPRVHVVVAGSPARAGAAEATALVLDEFGEVLPEPTVTTGLAVHYDAPNACPPQSILLAVHPDPASLWGWQLLDDIVLETLRLARLRLVELEDLAATSIDEYLPLTYMRDGLAGQALLSSLFKSEFWTDGMTKANRYVKGN